MSTNEIILAAVCGVLVVFSLAAALVLPRRGPGFPGPKLGAFLLAAAVLVGGTLAAVEVLGAEEEVEAATPAETAPVETEAPATAAPETAVPETAAPETEPPETAAPEAGADPVAGKEVFAAAGCGACHTLADAGAAGTVGPSLDESTPSAELVADRVTNGMGAMPPFPQLSEQEIADVAAYVAAATAG